MGCGFKRLYKRGDISGLKKSSLRWSGPLIGKLQITITTGRAVPLQLHCSPVSGGPCECVYEEGEMVTMPSGTCGRGKQAIRMLQR